MTCHLVRNLDGYNRRICHSESTLPGAVETHANENLILLSKFATLTGSRRTEMPPSTVIGLPVMKVARSLKRKRAAWAISLGVAIRFIG